MTITTKKLIELGDVLALQLSCKHCDATLSVSMREYQKRHKQSIFSNCPNCNSPWALVNNSTCEMTIDQFVEAFEKLSHSLSAEPGAFPAGFSLTLEIKDDKASNA